MHNKIFKNWNTMRIIRLLIGIAIVAEGIHDHDVTLMLAGAVVSTLPLLNIGCCCGNSCDVPRTTRIKHDAQTQQK